MPPDAAGIRDLLRRWLERRATAAGAAWLAARCAEREERKLFLAFSAVPRHVGREPLGLGPEDLAEADRLRPGWDPRTWTADHAGRTLLVLAWPHVDARAYVATLDKLFRSADLGELVALYQALPVLPNPEAHVKRCAEGVRTNMSDVFKAVAHRNPYPSEHLDEPAWNQMVLKALFVGVTLHPIHGLDARANPALMTMLVDYAHERWAAGRPVSPELWRPVGPYADDRALANLERVLKEGAGTERRAAALALRACPRPEAAALLERFPVELPADCDWSHLGGPRPPHP